MTESMEWNDLASQSLPTLTGTTTTTTTGGRADDTTRWNRGLSELNAASQLLLGSSSSTAGGGGVADRSGAQALLGSQTMSAPWTNLEQQQQQSRETTQQAPQRQQQPFESLDDRLARHEQEILNEIIQQTAQETRQKIDTLVEQQLQQAWEKERAVWVHEIVGTRTLGGAATAVASPLRLQQETASGPSTGTSQQQLIAVDPSQPRPSSSHLLPTSVIASPSLFVGPSRGAVAARETSRLDPSIVQAHLDIVKRMGRPLVAVQEFENLTAATQHTDSSAYNAAWRLLSHLLVVVPAGSSSSSSPVDLAVATLVSFCLQFQKMIHDRVRLASLAGQDVVTSTRYRSDMATQCASFVKLTVRDDETAPTTTTTAGMTDTKTWPILYYCLRCGDAVAALEVLKQSGNTEASVLRLVATMADFQGDASCLWQGDKAPPPPRLAASDRQAVFHLLESVKTRESTMTTTTTTTNLYEIGFYTLCCGMAQLPTSETVCGFSTIEDYLTGALWKTLFSSNPVDEIVKLGELIQSYGPAYFGDQGESGGSSTTTGGWAFALPLLATQQYEKALSHLADVGGNLGLLQAAHLGLVMATAEIPIRNVGQENMSSTFISALLSAYSNYLLTEPSAGSTAALEYLVRIPSKVHACKEVASLIAKTGDTERLVGVVNAEGIRQGGSLLDKYFTPDEISKLLADAAEQLLREKDNLQKTCSATMCYMLAGRYADVLMLLNQLLSPPDKPDKDRKFWLEQTESFHSFYLAKRTHVGEVLEKEGKMGVVKTSRTMVELNAFFDLVRANQRPEEALAVADRLNLLPTSQSDLASKESEYQGLDPLVKKALPSLIIAALELLHREHRQIKRDAREGISTVASERLRELQQRARLLVTYAGLVGVVSDQIESLSRLEALMI